MTEQDPFDRSTYASQPTAPVTRTDAPPPSPGAFTQMMDALEAGRAQAMLHAEMTITFYETLEAKFGEDRALWLTAQIWRSWPAD